MAPAAVHKEIAQTSESDMVSAHGTSRRKYAGAIALLVLVAVIVAGVGMHRDSVPSLGRDAEIGDIIEACADYTVQASCSAASCNWNSATVQCEEAAHRQKKASFLSTNNEPYVAAAEREDSANSTGNSSATTAAPSTGNSVSATGVITATVTANAPAGATSLTLADVTGLAAGMTITINGVTYTILSVTVSRRLSEDGRRLAAAGSITVAPALASAVTSGATISVSPAVANVVAANGVITATISVAASAGATVVSFSDVANLAVGMYLLINGAYYKIVSITPSRRLSEDGRRLAPAGTAGIAPALAGAVGAGTAITVLPATIYELTWWKDHGAKYAHAGPAFSAAAAAATATLATPATPAPATAVPVATAAPTPSPFGGHASACHQQFSAATAGQSNTAIQTVCASYNPGPNGACTTTDGSGWIATWCASRR